MFFLEALHFPVYKEYMLLITVILLALFLFRDVPLPWKTCGKGFCQPKDPHEIHIEALGPVLPPPPLPPFVSMNDSSNMLVVRMWHDRKYHPAYYQPPHRRLVEGLMADLPNLRYAVAASSSNQTQQS